MGPLSTEGYWVEMAELRDVRQLGWDNSGNSQMLHCTWSGREFVFKRYADGFRARADSHALGGQIRWRDELPRGHREHLDRIAAWPRFRVRDRGILLGVLLPYAPDVFFEPSAEGEPTRPRRFDHLIRFRAEGQSRPGAEPRMKLGALGHAVGALLWLHDRGVVANDVRETNILSARDGTAAYLVDCDAMIGPWGAVGPAAAPPLMADVVPQAADPTAETDLTRLAWVATWVLLDRFGLTDVPVEKLTAVIPAEDATLLARAAKGPVPPDAWRRMAGRWTSTWVGRVPMTAPPPRSSPSTAPAPTRPMTTPEQRVAQPYGRWVPEMFRQPWVVPAPQMMLPADSAAPEPAEPGVSPRTGLLIAGGAVVVMMLLAGLSLLLGS